MLVTDTHKQTKMELVMLENIVPQNHLLRLIDEHIDFSFINELCVPYYCKDNGRPAMAYRWFIGYGITDKLPDVSVIWQNRRRRFRHSDVPQQIFDEIVRQAMDAGLVDGKVLYTDSTHLKANANKGKFENVTVTETPKAYLKELDKAVAEDRKKHGKKPLKQKQVDETSEDVPLK